LRRLTILHDLPLAPQDPAALALGALGWVLSDDTHASRFVELTGITPDALRARLGERVVQAEILGFLMAHEPDLIAAAAALGVEPAALAHAHAALAGPVAENQP
jgi:Protein of unknown function (DUF3572)